MNELSGLAISAASVLLALALLFCLLRLLAGPTVMDRILAFDTICVVIVGFMALLGARWGTSLYLDLVLVFTLLGFFSTVAFTLYLHRRWDPGQELEPAPGKPPRAERRRR